MRSLIKKTEKSSATVAQCCAKVSIIVSGCHD